MQHVAAPLHHRGDRRQLLHRAARVAARGMLPGCQRDRRPTLDLDIPARGVEAVVMGNDGPRIRIGERAAPEGSVHPVRVLQHALPQ